MLLPNDYSQYSPNGEFAMQARIPARATVTLVVLSGSSGFYIMTNKQIKLQNGKVQNKHGLSATRTKTSTVHYYKLREVVINTGFTTSCP